MILFVPITVGGYVNIYGNDVTERKKAKEALKSSNLDQHQEGNLSLF